MIDWDKTERIIEYKKAFNDAYDCTPYTGDALQTTREWICLPSVLGLAAYPPNYFFTSDDEIPSGITTIVPMTFSGGFEKEEWPAPGTLAVFLSEFLWRLVCANDDPTIREWQQRRSNSPITFETPTPTEAAGILVIRIGWELGEEPATGRLYVRGRFAVLMKESNSGQTLCDEGIG